MVDFEAFVRSWVAGGTLSERGARVGLSAHQASAVAVRLRKRGVELPKISTGAPKGSRADVNALNRIIKAVR